MKPKISIVCLGVRDLNRALAFYRDGLGSPTHNYAEGDDYILFALALSAGAIALKQPHDAHLGGSDGAFADPDGHLWDIAFNPFADPA